MKKFILITLLLVWASPTFACNSPWEKCWAGQEFKDNKCSPEAQLMSAYEAKRWLRENPQWRLPSAEELKQHFLSSNANHLRQLAAGQGMSAVLSGDVMQHGNELLAVSVNIQTGAVELQPWRQPLLVLWRKTSW